MGEGKSLPIIGGIAFFLMLPLIIVIAMLFTAMGSLGNAAECNSGGTEGAAFGWPTDKHEAAQGWDDDGPEKHTGLDYEVAKGSKVMAAEEGTVVSTEGDWIKIRHQDAAVETWYEFFESKSVSVGDKVTRGQEIGKSGTGTEGAPGLRGDHLHFELRVRTGENGTGSLQPQDPTDAVGPEATTGTSSCSCGGGPLVGGNNQEKAFNFFASNGYSKEQAAGIVGNMIHESSVEPARLQNTPPGQITHPSAAAGSSLGWGIVQWTPAGKMINPSMQATSNDEAKVESLEWQLEFLRKQLEGEGPLAEGPAGQQVKAAQSVEDAAVAFGRYFERFAGSNDLSNPRYTERKNTAREVFETFGGGDAPAGGCGAGNGDIVATAKLLAWDTPGGHGKDEAGAKPEYQAAMPEWNGSTGDDPFSDCGVFVATVMRMSGADPDYPTRTTGVQENYLRTSGKYDVFDDITEDQLRPGDILIGPGHTYLFVGEFNGYNAASASLHGHVPEAGNTYSIGQQFAAARLKNPPAPKS